MYFKAKVRYISVEFAGYDIIAISETHLDDSVNKLDLNIRGFHELIRKNRNRFGGGVALYLST